MKEGSWHSRTKETVSFEEQSNQIYLLVGHTATHQILFCIFIFIAKYIYVYILFMCVFTYTYVYSSILCMQIHNNENYDRNTYRLIK